MMLDFFGSGCKMLDEVAMDGFWKRWMIGGRSVS